jgi:hypothetical protein
MSDEGAQAATDMERSGSSGHDLRREALVMALYVSIVTLAALVALPSDYGESHNDAGHSDPSLLALVWGTSVGLALAHWFAFELAAIGFHAGRLERSDIEEGVAQIGGALSVSIGATIAILLADDPKEVRAAAFVPALIIGVAGYGVARTAGRPVFASLIIGLITLAGGLAVAVIKATLIGH